MNVMEIVKKRRFEVACLAAVLILLLALVPVSQKGTAAAGLADDIDGLLRRISTLLSSGGKAGPANPEKIEARREYAELLNARANLIIEQYENINRRDPLVPGLFPDPGDGTFSFRHTYDKAIDSLFKDTLRAGWPGEQEPGSSPPLSDEDEAANFGIYAKRENLNIGDWVTGSTLPTGEDCWFGQLSYWIQQDLALIINELNQDAADQLSQTPNVKNAAVKRIISIHVDPFYFIGEKKQQTGFSPGTDPQRGRPPGLGLMGPGAMGLGGPPGMLGAPSYGGQGMGPGYGTPTSGTSSTARKAKKGRIYKDDPFTARSSDDKADVLHFTFSLVIDSRKINQFLDTLAHRNLYTILSVSIARQDLSVDGKKLPRDTRAGRFNPASDAREDLLYGPDPVVQIDVAAEALFLRSLYGEMMPTLVNELLKDRTKALKRRRQELADMAKEAKKKRGRRRKPKRPRDR